MIRKNTKILVAVSGGVDSVYMLNHLIEEGYTNLGVAHFNHQLRDESIDDYTLVEGIANQEKLPYFYESGSVKSISVDNNESIELTARKLRRLFYERIMEFGNYKWLALGHHADDQAETVLFNFMRGSGVHGLAGMLKIDPKQFIFRPLLDMTKDEIYKAASSLDLKWNEDHTNSETDYDRCWLRNEIIPAFEKRRKGTKKILSDTAQRFAEMSDYFKTEGRDWLCIRDGDDHAIHQTDFLGAPTVIKAEIVGALWEYINGSRQGFSSKVVFEVDKWLQSKPQGGTAIHFGEKNLTLDKGWVKVLEKNNK